jgi:peptidylprolyl isomerase
MKRSQVLPIFAAALLAASSAHPTPAQTAAPARPAAAHSATAAAHPAAAKATACVKLPELSPKIPALPAGLPCAHALYTISTVPGAKLDYVSPIEGPDLKEELGLEPLTFSLAYIEVKVGTGEVAAPHKWYTIHYSGYLADGTKFDSSFDHPDHAPITVEYGQHKLIAGWDTGLNGMRMGGKRRLFIPYQLGYGAADYPPNRPVVIPAKSELIFDVELISQSDHAPPPPTPPAAPPASKSPPSTPAAPAGAAPPAPASSAPSGTPGPTPAAQPAGTTPPPGATPPAGPPKPQ